MGKHPLGHSRLLLVLSVVAVQLAWFYLHTAFAVHYARLYYEAKDIHGRPFKAGRRSGFRFPGTEIPTYLDFLYVSLSVVLTYDPHDVDVENPVMRRNVIVHMLVSFFFNTVVLVGGSECHCHFLSGSLAGLCRIVDEKLYFNLKPVFLDMRIAVTEGYLKKSEQHWP